MKHRLNLGFYGGSGAIGSDGNVERRCPELEMLCAGMSPFQEKYREKIF